MLLIRGVDQGLGRAALAKDDHTKPLHCNSARIHEAARPRTTWLSWPFGVYPKLEPAPLLCVTGCCWLLVDREMVRLILLIVYV